MAILNGTSLSGIQTSIIQMNDRNLYRSLH